MHYTIYQNTALTPQQYLDWMCAGLNQAGWELWDPVSGSDFVYRSKGEAGKFPYLYVRIYLYSGQLTAEAYLYWNKVSHAGICRNYQSSAGLSLDMSRSHYTPAVFSGDKNIVLMSQKGLTENYTMPIGCLFGHIDKLFGKNDCKMKITAPVTAGAGVTVTVDSSADAKPGRLYQLVGGIGEGRWVCSVSAVISETQVILSEVPVNLGTDETNDLYPFVGDRPHRGGITLGSAAKEINKFYPVCPIGKSGIDQDAGDFCWQIINVLDTSYSDPAWQNLYIPSQYLLREAGYTDGRNLSYIGYIDPANIGYLASAAHDECYGLSDEIRESGSVSAGSATSISDSTKTWSVGALADAALILVDGLGAGQTRRIQSNTADSVTVFKAFDPAPGNGTLYRVVDKAYRKFKASWSREYLIRENIF